MNMMNEKILCMVKPLIGVLIITFLSLPYTVFGGEYPYKKADDFKTLDSYKSVEEFETSYKQYTQHCLDNTGGGSGSVPCFISYDMWDRELNMYYKKLVKALGERDRKFLKDSQLAWIKERERTIDFNSRLLDEKYPSIGTMYIAMRAGDADEMITPIVRHRALLLKKWLEVVGQIKDQKTEIHNEALQRNGRKPAAL